MEFLRRGKQTPLLGTTSGEQHTSAPILAVGIGTTGCTRAFSFVEAAAEAGGMSAIQSVVCYDSNQRTVEELTARTNKLKAPSMPAIFLPEYIPSDDGFHRDPDRVDKFFGLLDRELERLVNGAFRNSMKIGASPQIIVEFFGCGGHIKLAGVLHSKLRETFPDAMFLPVLALPQDSILEKRLRDKTWSIFEEPFSGERVLITDNKMGSFRDIDRRLSTGLASIATSQYSDPTANSMADIVSVHKELSGGWFGMSVVRRPLLSQRVRKFGVFSERKISVGRSNKLAEETRFAVWKSFEPFGQLARHASLSAESPQHLIVELPLSIPAMEETKSDVMDQLTREGLFEQYPNLKVAFASARFESEAEDEEDLYVTRFFALGGPIESIDEIMEVSPPADPPYQTGFGSGYYSSTQAVAGASEAVQDQVEKQTAVSSPDGEASDIIVEEVEDREIQVFIVEDEANLRQVYRRILEGDERFFVVGEAGTAEDALESSEIKKADVVTMDIILPGMNGIEATRQIKMLYPQIKIIMVSALSGELREQAATAGSDGYVPKAIAHETLVDTIIDVASK